MQIRRKKLIIGDNIVEYRWHYDKSTVITLLDKFKMYLGAFIASHLLFYGTVIFGPMFLLYLFSIISFKQLILLILLYFSTYLLFKPQLKINAFYIPWIKFNPLWEWSKFYSNFKIIRLGETDLIKNRQYIFGVVPHGILCCNRVCMMGNIFFDEVYPETFGRFAAATPQFYLPGLREIAIFSAANDASKYVFENILKNTSDSIYLWPGGSRELLLTNPNSTKTYLVLNDRKGFIKLAIRNGIDIIPVFQFNEKYFYKLKVFNKNNIFIKLLYNIFKVPGILFYGKYYSMLPYPPNNNLYKSLGMVFDLPIKVNKQLNPSESYINEIHKIYKERINNLFNKYKNEFCVKKSEKLEMISSKESLTL